MKAIDMTSIIKKYQGCFVALSYDRKKVLGKGYTPEEALRRRMRRDAKTRYWQRFLMKTGVIYCEADKISILITLLLSAGIAIYILQSFVMFTIFTFHCF